MGNTYKVQVLHFSNILEIEGARTTRDFEALLVKYGLASGTQD